MPAVKDNLPAAQKRAITPSNQLLRDAPPQEWGARLLQLLGGSKRANTLSFASLKTNSPRI
jgi:hypothetical protein